jgi:steroid 5-alpha reductase family enzyme
MSVAILVFIDIFVLAGTTILSLLAGFAAMTIIVLVFEWSKRYIEKMSNSKSDHDSYHNVNTGK